MEVFQVAKRDDSKQYVRGGMLTSETNMSVFRRSTLYTLSVHLSSPRAERTCT